MTRSGLHNRLRAGLALACLLPVAAAAWATAVDPTTSHIGFTLETRWGQVLTGEFPEYDGEVVVLADGRQQVRLRLDARAMRIVDHPGYTRFARGGGFFDVAEWPRVKFMSDPYAPALLRLGGPLGGRLSLRGVERDEVFQVHPSACARPGHDCDIVASGSVHRADYGMTRWGFVLTGDVLFELRIRLHDDGTGA